MKRLYTKDEMNAHLKAQKEQHEEDKKNLREEILNVHQEKVELEKKIKENKLEYPNCEYMKLSHCKKCNQMTNHKIWKGFKMCMKCKEIDTDEMNSEQTAMDNESKELFENYIEPYVQKRLEAKIKEIREWYINKIKDDYEPYKLACLKEFDKRFK